ncbi:MAG: ATP-binding cassette domain-containing protein [Planctomycetota bacterium]|nr:MAG: ATP-binding cassette domain-containing protein [Planctomycetota bacterium]
MLRVEGLRRQVGVFHLRIDEWAIEPGQYLVLVGPSGAGKTMLLETIAGLHRPDAGRIWIDGREVTSEPPEALGIGFVYQDCWLFPHLTVRQNIDFGRRYHQKSGASPAPKTDELTDMLHITDLLDRNPQTLSGGERQRVALARALAIQPRLLFLDEPLGTLDPVTREHVGTELQNCHRSFGITTIHVTHDHSEARTYGDSIAVILDGKLEQMGPTDEVFRRPRTAKLGGFLGCENMYEAQAVPTAEPDMIKIDLHQTTFTVRSHKVGRVSLCVRAEDVLVERAAGKEGKDERDDYNIAAAFTGRIVTVSQPGAMVRLVIDVSGRRWVSIVSHSQQRQHRFCEGNMVTLRIPNDALHLISLE